MTRVNPQKKPLLLAFEGPPGAGKTRLSTALMAKCDPDRCIYLAEFSETPLGTFLEEQCQFGSKKPHALQGLSGALAFLSDKIYQLSRAGDYYVAVSDRHLLTQKVVTLPSIPERASKQAAAAALESAEAWAREVFSGQSLIVHLTGETQILANRLQRRLGRRLTRAEIARVQYERQSYVDLFSRPHHWRAATLQSDKSERDLIHEIRFLLKESGLVLG